MTASLPALTVGSGSMKIETSSIAGLPQSTPFICNGLQSIAIRPLLFRRQMVGKLG